MKKIRQLIPLVFFLVIICPCHDQIFGATIAKLLAKARPGQLVRIPSGTYVEDVIVPAGVSITGRGPDRTLIVGSIELSGTSDHPATLSYVRIIHTGGSNTSAVQCAAGELTIHHSYISSEGGFAAIGAGKCRGHIFNNIIIGPVGDYAIFGRGGAKIDIVNNTIFVQSFGIGLMDQSFASIRNCLLYGQATPAVIRTDSDYSIAYTNLSLSGASYYFAHDLINNDIMLPAIRQGVIPTAGIVTNKDVTKYDSIGLIFLKQDTVKYRSVGEFRRHQPDFARHAGSPAKEDRNADGSRNDLGAFGGKEGQNWSN